MIKRTIVTAAVLGVAFAMPAFAAKSEQRVYGTAAGSSTTLKNHETKGKKKSADTARTASSPQANAAAAKRATPAPSPSKKTPTKPIGFN